MKIYKGEKLVQGELVVKVAKESISELTKTKIPLTPDNYSNIFCKIAKKYNLQLGDCNKLSQFLPKLDDNSLEELKKYNLRTTDELFNFLAAKIKRISLITKTKTKIENNDLSLAVENLVYALKPSLSNKIDTLIKEVTATIETKPKKIVSKEFTAVVRNIVNKRVEADTQEFRSRTRELDSIILNFSQRIVTAIENGNINNTKLLTIKDQLLNISLGGSHSLQSAKTKLIDITASLEGETTLLIEELGKDKEQIVKLETKVKALEEELKRTQEESNVDFLTQLYTKRALDRELKKVEDGFKRYGNDFSVCFVDIDHFKNVNDTYGHSAGDIILQTIGKLIKEHSRDVDVVGRYGGEEFLVILPSTNLKNGTLFASKLRESIEKKKFVYEGKEIPITASFGVSQRKQHIKLEDTINQADKMLYKAKESGRNMVFPSL